MTIAIDISPQAERSLYQRAQTAGISLPQLLTQIVEEASALSTSAARPETGAQLVDALTKDGTLGAWKDREDIVSTEQYARELRYQAEHRESSKGTSSIRT